MGVHQIKYAWKYMILECCFYVCIKLVQKHWAFKGVYCDDFKLTPTLMNSDCLQSLYGLLSAVFDID